MKLIMENWRKYLLNENEEEIRDAVIDAVKDEGGAADLDTIEDKVDIPPGFDLANFIKAMSGIGQSEHGDYVIDDEDSEGQVQVSKEDLQEGIKIFLQEKKKSSGKKDACYRKVKARYKVWPSAYASGALVRCRKVGAKNWGNKSKKKK